MTEDNSTTDSDTYSTHKEATEAAKRLFKHNDDVSIEEIKQFDWSQFEVTQAISEAQNAHREEHILGYLYWVEGLTQEKIADRFGYSRSYIGQNMTEIPTGPDPTKHFASVGHYFNEDREKVYSSYQGQQPFAYVHRLTKVAECGIDALEGDEDTEMVVHHQNGHPLDNRPENLQLMEKEEHDNLHTSDNSEFIIKNGEAILVQNPDDEARRAVDEWLSGDLDELDESDIPDADEIKPECLKQAIERLDDGHKLFVEDVESDVEADVASQGA